MESHDFREDRLSRLVRRAVEQDIISLSRGAEILGLQLEQMRALAATWVA
jgi:predicted HTH domain antitoxin